jgi:hypothetical protein
MYLQNNAIMAFNSYQAPWNATYQYPFNTNEVKMGVLYTSNQLEACYTMQFTSTTIPLHYYINRVEIGISGPALIYDNLRITFNYNVGADNANLLKDPRGILKLIVSPIDSNEI